MAACRMLGGSSSAPDPLGQAEDGLKKIIFAQTRRIRAPSKGGNSRITSQYFSAADPENPSPAPNCMTRATRQHFFLLFPAPNLVPGGAVTSGVREHPEVEQISRTGRRACIRAHIPELGGPY